MLRIMENLDYTKKTFTIDLKKFEIYKGYGKI